MHNKVEIEVDLANPGHFFACCGILYCADKMYSLAEGYFVENKFVLKTDSAGNALNSIVESIKLRLDEVELQNNEKNQGRTDAHKHSNRPMEIISADNNKSESQIWLDIHKNVKIRLDFWNHFDNRPKIKLFAGRETSKNLVNRWVQHIKNSNWSESIESLQDCPVHDLPSGLDTSTSWNALDVGFSLNVQKEIKRQTYPLIEFFAYIGVQTYSWSSDARAYCYRVWQSPLSSAVARTVAAGALTFPNTKTFRFISKKSGQKQIFNRAYEILD